MLHNLFQVMMKQTVMPKLFQLKDFDLNKIALGILEMVIF